MSANVNAFVVSENEKVMHNVENKNDVEIKNVVVNGFYRDYESETLMIGGQVNGYLLCAGCPADTVSADESDDTSETRRV